MLSLKGLQRFKDYLVGIGFAKYLAATLRKLGLTPNRLTMISISLGLFGVYFLFVNHSLFVLFYGLHLLFDVFDGFYARYMKMETGLGDKLDHAGDLFIAMLLLIKSAIWLDSGLPLILFCMLIAELILLRWLELLGTKVPTRIFSYFFFFRLFTFGFWFQLIYQPLSIVLVLWSKFSRE